MRKSQPTRGFRPLKTGVAVAATTALVLAYAAAPAYAVVAVTLDTTTAPIGGGTTVTANGSGAYPSLTATVLAGRTVSSTTTCPTTYGTTGTTAAVSRTDADNADVTVPALAAGAYKICIYGVASGLTVGSGAALAATSDTLTVNAASTHPTLSATAGSVVGGNTITATGVGPYLTSVSASPGVVFNAGACPSTYTTTAGNIVATGVKTSTSVATITVPGTLTASTAYNVCIYAGTTAQSALLGSPSSTYTGLPVATLLPRAGSSGLASTITVTGPTSTTFPSSPTVGVTLTTAACPATYSTASTRYVGPFAATPLRISGSKIAVTLPITSIETGAGQATTPWNVCVYTNGTNGTLKLAPATYTVAPVLAVTNTASPAGGPAQGGTEVTITGTGFPYPLTDSDTLEASIGGSDLTDLRTTASTTLIGTTTSHAAGAAAISVTTAAGTQQSSGTPFTYSYGITVSPTTAAPSASVTMDIQGAGFSSLSFEDFPAVGGTVTAGKAHVMLVDNAWFAANSGSPDEAFADGNVYAECADVIAIGDNELICTMDLTADINALGETVPTTPAGSGVYTIVVVNGTTGLTSTQHSIVSSGSTFTVSTY